MLYKNSLSQPGGMSIDRKPQNPIQKARIRRGLTQEGLAERTGYSADSIRAWESGVRMPSLEALEILQRELRAPWLTGRFLRIQTEALAPILPNFEVDRPLAEAAARYISCILAWTDGRFDRHLLAMIADGRIDETEKADYSAIMEMAEQTTKAYLELKFADTRKEPRG